MNGILNYINKLDITAQVTDEEIKQTQALLRIYRPAMKHSANSLEEMDDECHAARAQSITDFIVLSVNYDQDTDRRRIAERLAGMGHSMQFLMLLEETLLRVRDEPKCGDFYYQMLKVRYFDAYCSSNEDAFLTLGIASSTYYRNIKKAVKLFAAYLWHAVIPDLIISERRKSAPSSPLQ